MKVRFGLIIISVLGLLVILYGTLYLAYDSSSEKVATICSPKSSFDYVTCMISGLPSILHPLFWLIVIALYLLSFMLVYLSNVDPAKDQRRFIADASHELRTPLSIMKSTTEIALLDHRGLSTDARRVMESNIEEIDRMSIIIEKLISIAVRQPAEGTENRDNQYFSKINLASVVERVSVVLVPLAQKKGVALRLNNLEPSRVWGNKLELEELVVNLIRNAITFTQATGVIDVSVTSRKDRSACLRVHDTGAGILREDLGQIFEPFHRGKNVGRHHNHPGLGLVVAKSIVDRHNGIIKIKSEPQKGTVVTVIFRPSNA